ncbi:MAG TPA: acetate--CoA ligase family protein [Methylomirabilota bacterium]
MARHVLDYFANPASIAVIGASTVLHKAGGRRWRSMVEAGFPGGLYPIHPTASEILGHKAYRSLRDLPAPPELAVVLVRPDLVPEALADCADLRVPAVVIITAGFGETGPDGKRREREMVARLRGAGGRMIGPNCAGLFSASGRVNVLGWGVPGGPIGVISQSGNMALTFVQLARDKGIGISKLITVGNAADLRIPEYLEYLQDDPDTRVIVAYLEGFEPDEGRAIWDLMRRLPAPKPVVVIKPGETDSGRRAALSHTGALAGQHRVVEAALRQCRILRVADTEEAWDAAIALALLPVPEIGTVVVVSDGGGHATIVADSADKAGLVVPSLSPETRAALAAVLPPRSGIGNPVDFAGVAEEEPEVVPRVLDIALGDPQIGGALVAGHFGGYVKIATEELGLRECAAAEELARVIARRGKPVIVHTIYGEQPLPALAPLRAAGVPIYRSLEGSARAMGALWRHARGRRRPAAEGRRSRPDPARVDALLSGRRAGEVVPEPACRELLALYGIAVPRWWLAASATETADAIAGVAGPAAVKLVARGVVHKSDVGGVLLGVSGRGAATEAWTTLMAVAERAGATDARVLVTAMLEPGVETVVGVLRDRQFGPVVMFGLGGVLVEALDDVVFRLAPFGAAEAERMLGEVRGHRLFDAVRGRPAVDRAAIADVLVRVSELAADRPEVAELDLNPVILTARGAAIADARAVIG